MTFPYSTNKDDIIINYENEMLKKCIRFMDNYTDVFKKYNCSLKIGLFWRNFLKNKVSENRLPFKNGYECCVYCEIQRDGKIVRIISHDGDADWYDLVATCPVSHISRFFFKNNVALYDDIDDFKESIKVFVNLLADE